MEKREKGGGKVEFIKGKIRKEMYLYHMYIVFSNLRKHNKSIHIEAIKL